jgi:hypothetical protein
MEHGMDSNGLRQSRLVGNWRILLENGIRSNFAII